VEVAMTTRHELAIRRLKEIGGRHGHVTLEQVKDALPIDEMTSEEIGRIVMQLEEAGVEVRLDDEELLRPRPSSEDGERRVPADVLSGDAAPAPTPIPPSDQRRSTLPPRDAPAGLQEEGPGQDGRGPRRTATRWGLLITVVVLVAAAATLLYALAS
jgi:hypothetical protein